MARKAQALSHEAEALLSQAIRQEYAELRVRSAADTWNSSEQQKAYRAKKKIVRAYKRVRIQTMALEREKQAIARFERLRNAKPTRGKYPHFVAAALSLLRRGQSITAIARYGVEFLPGLDDVFNPSDHEIDLIAQIRKAATRKQGTKSRSSKPNS